MRRTIFPTAIMVLGLVASAPAIARVHEETATSFVVRLGVEVPVGPGKVWDMLIRPADWWDSENSYSGDAANLSLDPRAGGCFCEVLPAKDSQDGAALGGAEHMRVVYAERPRALRMVGALGPIQPDAVTGVMTMILQPSDTGTRILWEYAVAGHIRKPGMAAAVDAALTSQILRLGGKLGARAAPRSPADAKGEAEAEAETEAEAEAEAEAPLSDQDRTEAGPADRAGDRPADMGR